MMRRILIAMALVCAALFMQCKKDAGIIQGVIDFAAGERSREKGTVIHRGPDHEKTGETADAGESGAKKIQLNEKSPGSEKGTRTNTGDATRAAEKNSSAFTAKKNETIIAKKEKKMSDSAGKKRGLKATDTMITAGKKKNAAVKNKHKTVVSTGKKSGLETADTVITADNKKSDSSKKESDTIETGDKTSNTGKKSVSLIDAGRERKPAGFLVKPRVEDPEVK